MWDTHAHLNFAAFNDDWRAVADRAVAAGVEKMVVVGTDIATSRRAVELANSHEALYAAVGIHPHHAREILREIPTNKNQKPKNNQLSNSKLQFEQTIRQMAQLAQAEKVVAIGEIGLDYYTYKSTRYPADLLVLSPELKQLQRELFLSQVELAKAVDKPLIIHSREAGDDVLESLPQGVRGVFHCFGGSKKYVKRILEAGFYVSFTGQILYIPDRAAVAKLVPLERLLLETDSPLIAPVRGERNEPVNVRLIAKKHAQDRGLNVDEVVATTSVNARSLFTPANLR